MPTNYLIPPGTYSNCAHCHGRWDNSVTVLDGDTLNCGCGATLYVGDWVDFNQWPAPVSLTNPQHKSQKPARLPRISKIVLAVTALLCYLAGAIVLAILVDPGTLGITLVVPVFVALAYAVVMDL